MRDAHVTLTAGNAYFRLSGPLTLTVPVPFPGMLQSQFLVFLYTPRLVPVTSPRLDTYEQGFQLGSCRDASLGSPLLPLGPVLLS